MNLSKEQLRNKYKTADSLLKRIDEVKGKTFRCFDVNRRLNNPKNKGALGQIVEEGIFGYPINSDPSADFDYLGLELKTTGVVQNKNQTISAKERLALDSLNYKKVAIQDFIESDMWIKSKGLLLVLYKYIQGYGYGDMPIVKGMVYRFPPEDLAIIMHDYEIIASKIKNGKAELLSESDTMYLGACTSGSDSNDLVEQPFSSVLAKRRRFCLKQSYMNQIIRRNLGYSELEHIFSVEDIRNNLFEYVMEEKLKPFFGKTESDIKRMFNLDTLSKSRFERYLAKMIGINGKVNDTDEFLKSNTELKTIRIEEDGKIVESMSFPHFKFIDIANTDWDNSSLKEFLETKRFMFAIFQKKKGEYVFKQIKFWSMPIDIIENECRNVYEKTAEVIKSGNIIKEITKDKRGNEIRRTNFPGMSFNGVIHVRPHGRDSKDVDTLPVEDRVLKTNKYTKHCFWINNSFIKKVINE